MDHLVFAILALVWRAVLYGFYGDLVWVGDEFGLGLAFLYTLYLGIGRWLLFSPSQCFEGQRNGKEGTGWGGEDTGLDPGQCARAMYGVLFSIPDLEKELREWNEWNGDASHGLSVPFCSCVVTWSFQYTQMRGRHRYIYPIKMVTLLSKILYHPMSLRTPLIYHPTFLPPRGAWDRLTKLGLLVKW